VDVGKQADARLERARKKAVREAMFEKMALFTYQAEHVERRRGDTDWTCRLRPIGPEGEIVRGLYLTVKAPSPLDFDRTYAWELLAFCPLWVHYYSRNGSFTFAQNTRPTDKLG
jgi:hypothetical protein